MGTVGWIEIGVIAYVLLVAFLVVCGFLLEERKRALKRRGEWW